ncbi:MAG: prolipoprotein diacylglyceryl transferase [Thermodesulfovibrionia bacterium]|nr:prolipoprotein diacylglyceryl transferase [Thermodesulfovibrionia bacterium]
MNNFTDFWQHIPEHINPNIIAIGQFQIRYYGMMYIVAFAIVYLLVIKRVKGEGFSFTKETIQDAFVWMIVGLMAGGRLGYVLFYNLNYYLSHPLEIFLPFSFENGIQFIGIAGMSYHGGLVGLITAALLFCRKRKIDFWYFTDLFAPVAPLGYTFGRIGNFINGELYGRETTAAWGMYFPLDSDTLLRHPSQLYEAFFEGLILFIILWSVRKKSPFNGFLLSLYLIGYGLVRFVIEFFRQPDPQLGFILGPLSMGQALCLTMIICGAAIYFIRSGSKA